MGSISSLSGICTRPENNGRLTWPNVLLSNLGQHAALRSDHLFPSLQNVQKFPSPKEPGVLDARLIFKLTHYRIFGVLGELVGSIGQERSGSGSVSETHAIEIYLRGYTVVKELRFSSSSPYWKSILHLMLENDDGEIRTVEFDDVQQLELREFSGFSQLMLIQVDDLRQDKLDRVHFRVRDTENGRISFVCAAARISN